VLNETARRQRAGFTLVELTVALTVGGLVLALIVGIAVRQQRVFGDIADVTALESRLREAAAILPIDLRAVAPALGDLRAATDTAVEVRATIATAIVCDTNSSRIVLTPTADYELGTRNAARFSSFSSPIVAGDTAWLLSATDTSDDWVPYAVASVATTGARTGSCAPIAPKLDAAGAAMRVALSLVATPAASSLLGLPIRVTRPVRYSLYRASDGAWYLGARDWNYSTTRFNTIQPVAGPFLAASDSGLRFSFVDSGGTALGPLVSGLSLPRAVRIDLRGETHGAERALGTGITSKRRIDFVSTAAAFRGGGCC
jgi:prepilin-type N-terminal cleavage/methylation domain-containing protein